MKLYDIGSWISRERSGLAHYVESTVAGDVVTRCGKRLTDEPTKSGGRLVPGLFGLRKCSVCLGPDQPEA